MTKREKIFVKEYILSKNGAESVRKAGFKCREPRKYAYELLQKPDITRQVEEEFKALMEQYDLKEDDIKLELGKIVHDRNDHKTSDRLRAIELAGKALGMFKDTNVNVSIYQSINKDKVDKIRKSLSNKRLNNS